MKNSISIVAVLLLGSILATGNAFARSAGHGRNPNNPEREEQMRWFPNVSDASAWASSGSFPIMVCVTRIGNAEDLKAAEKIGSWPTVWTASTTSFAAVKTMNDSQDATELLKLMGPKSVPGLIWLDQYGNPILSQPMPTDASGVTNVIVSWKATLATIDHFFKEHQTRGDTFLKNGKLREAYIEYSLTARFKGPNADKAREAQAKVTESWSKMAANVAKLPVGSRDSVATLKGLREEVKNLDYAPVLEKDLATAMLAAADSSKVAENSDSKHTVVEVAAVPETPAASTQPPAPEKAAPIKTLAEIARLSMPVTREAAEPGINVTYLISNKNPTLKQAGDVLQQGISAFQKATAESMERGDARNKLLQTAHTNFDKSITLLEEASAGKPDDTVKRLEERVSMLLYASLKYQSL